MTYPKRVLIADDMHCALWGIITVLGFGAWVGAIGHGAR